jgi:chemotaxis protein MotA
MMIATLIDPASAAIVAGGTLAATLLQCGTVHCRAVITAVGRLSHRRFDPERVRAELARHVHAIRQDGVVRARGPGLGDAEIDEATEALIEGRSVGALIEAHESHRARRIATNEQARATLLHGAELAPVFGLAGTLLSLARLADGVVAENAFAAAIGAAVLTTLYGLLLAHLVLAPLARGVERAALTEERARQEVIDWLATQLGPALPRSGAPHSDSLPRSGAAHGGSLPHNGTPRSGATPARSGPNRPRAIA